MQNTLLAVDVGTTGVTTLLLDDQLNTLGRASQEFEQCFPAPGQVEHSAEAILGALDATLIDVLNGISEPPVAVGITNQRETVFALDLDSGRCMGRGIVWQDRRTADRCSQLRQEGREPLVRQRTGLLLDPYFSATKIEWMLAHRPGVAEAARAGHLRFCTVDALVLHHLTRGEECATDPTNAARTMLYDIEAKGWCPDLGAVFGVECEWLPPVRASVGELGLAQLPGGLNAPIRGMAGDQQAALFGQGCLEPGTLKNTYGTGCFLLLNTGATRVDSDKGLLTTLAVGPEGQSCYALEGSVFSGGLILQWLRDGLGMLETAAQSEELAASVTSSEGVHLVPAFAGLGAPYWDPDARAALLGLTRGSDRRHIARAALDAIAYQCAELIEILREDTGLAIEELRVDGGAAANNLLMGLQADMANLEVVRPDQVEATARGAAALAGVGSGLWEDPIAALAPRSQSARFGPTIDSIERAQRMGLWRAAVERVRSHPSP